MEKLHTSKFKLIVKVLTLLCVLNVFNSWGQVSHIVISQVYGGGGNTSAPYQNDFVELYNPTCSAINISGYSVQYASGASTSWSSTGALNGSIAAGGYYLIKLGGGAVGVVLPTPDLSSTGINISATAGKVVLVSQTAALTATVWPISSVLIDGIGYGTAGNFEGSAAAPAGSNTTADKRNSDCTDTDNNSSDFSAVAPNPRNSATAISLCPSCSGGCTSPATPPAPTAAANPACSIATLSVGSSTVAGVTWYWQTSASGTSATQPTSSSYTTSAATSTVYVRAQDNTGLCWSTNSSSIAVTVNTPPSISTQPANKTVCAGSGTTFSIVASGTSPTYQWQVNDGLGGGYVNVSTGLYTGGTTAILSLTSTTSSMNSYSYQCIVSVSACSSVTSTVGVLTVNSTPGAPSAPTSPTTTACSIGTVSAFSAPGGGVNWYWQTSSSGTATGTLATSNYTSSSTFTLFARALDASGTCWSASSSSIVVTVTQPVTLTSQPSNRNVCVGGNTTFAIAGGGAQPKQWWYSSDAGATYTIVPTDAVHTGTTVSTLTLTSIPQSLNGYVYHCLVSPPGCPVVTSGPGTLTVAPPQTISISPASQTLCTGSTAAITVTTSAASASYTWQSSSTGTSGWSTVANSTPAGFTYSGINTSSLSITSSTANTYYYRCQITDGGACSANSGTVTVVFNAGLSIITQPVNEYASVSGTATFTVVTSSSATYQWLQSSGGAFTALTDGGANPTVSGATTAVLSIANPPLSMSGYSYYCAATNSCGTVSTNTVTLYVGTSLCLNETFTSVSAPSGWAPRSLDFSNGTSAEFAATSGTLVTVAVSNPNLLVFDLRRTTSTATKTLNVYVSYTSQSAGFIKIATFDHSNTISGGTTSCVVDLSLYSGVSPIYIAFEKPYGTPTSSWFLDNVEVYCKPLIGNAISSGNVASPPFSVATCTSTAGGSIDFTSTGTYNSGNVYTAQLSNAGGDFVDAVAIGTFSSTASSGTINVTIPAGITSGTGYQIRVVSSNPVILSTLSNSFTITSGVSTPTYPIIKSLFVEACKVVCASEAQGEAVFLNSGSSSLNVTTVAQATANVNLWYGSTASLTQANHITNNYVTNTSAINCLNSMVGCTSTSFIDALGSTIPANSIILILRSDFCCSSSPDNNFSAFCGSGSIYVLFSSDGGWQSTGNFKNFDASLCPGPTYRYLQLNSAASSSTFATNYDVCKLTTYSNSTDGGYVLWSACAGAAVTYSNNGCNVSKTILPIELLDFYATKNGKKNDLVWKVATEENIVYYIIGKSNDGVNFTDLGTVNSTNSTQVKSYTIFDDTPFDDITYYRLGTLENDGKVYYHKIISVDEKSSEWNSIHYQQEQNLIIEFKNLVPKNSTITLFDLSGKLLVEQAVNESQTKINTQNFSQGIYFLKIATPYKTENFKIIITK